MTYEFANWVGRQETAVDILEAARSRALLATLGRPDDLKTGDCLPLLHHWLYFWDVMPPDRLGPDGHPKRGKFLPPVALPRRMWAGSRLSFHAPLIVGETIRRVSTIRKVETKTGRTGTLVFVTVGHETSGAMGLAVTEEQDIVYREAPPPGASPQVSEPDNEAFDWRQTAEANSVLLFRYSALTLNGHRIHYDQDYTRNTEGYPGLVVQGPLQAQLLIDLAGDHMQVPIVGFTFRGLSPATDRAPLDVRGAKRPGGAAMWTVQEGRRCMAAEVKGGA